MQEKVRSSVKISNEKFSQGHGEDSLGLISITDRFCIHYKCPMMLFALELELHQTSIRWQSHCYLLLQHAGGFYGKGVELYSSLSGEIALSTDTESVDPPGSTAWLFLEAVTRMPRDTDCSSLSVEMKGHY